MLIMASESFGNELGLTKSQRIIACTPYGQPSHRNPRRIPTSAVSGEGLLVPGSRRPAVESAPVFVEKRQAQD